MPPGNLPVDPHARFGRIWPTAAEDAASKGQRDLFQSRPPRFDEARPMSDRAPPPSPFVAPEPFGPFLPPPDRGSYTTVQKQLARPFIEQSIEAGRNVPNTFQLAEYLSKNSLAGPLPKTMDSRLANAQRIADAMRLQGHSDRDVAAALRRMMDSNVNNLPSIMLPTVGATGVLAAVANNRARPGDGRNAFLDALPDPNRPGPTIERAARGYY